jgi:exoribonuclease R
VYIANIWVWIEAFDLWPHIGNRVSTIYLPDRKRSMLPTLIAEEYSSLDAGKECFAMAMDFIVENDEIVKIEKPLQKLICLHKHFHYDDPKLFKNKNYQLLETVTKTLDSSVSDSHDVVAYWMMKMNTSMAKLMRQKEIGIYRVVKSQNMSATNVILPMKMKQFVRIWEQKVAGKYEIFHQGSDLKHMMLELDEYIHFTSPIRRMVDLINHLYWLLSEFSLPVSVSNFVEAFQFNMTHINAKMSDIKKVQNDCNILHQVTNEPEILDKQYNAVVITRHDDHMYSVYIEDLKWIAKIYTTEPLNIYDIVYCKLYVFVKEEQLRKKVRVQIV